MVPIGRGKVVMIRVIHKVDGVIMREVVIKIEVIIIRKGWSTTAREVGQLDDSTHHYAIPGKTKVVVSDIVIMGIVLLYDQIAYVLFDLGSIYSYVSIRFTLGLNLFCDVLKSLMYTSTLVGDSVMVTHMYHACFIIFSVFSDLGRLDHFGQAWFSHYFRYDLVISIFFEL